ncbi:MAG: PhzF family phenazine biosynthesis protein, partial [Mangrovicoccus sp.]
VFPPETETGTAKVRIFTPTLEIPFAGHPTIGTAIALAMQGEAFGMATGPQITLEEGVGPIPCAMSQSGDLWQAELQTDTDLECFGPLAPELAAAMLGLSPQQIETALHEPQFASKGLAFALVELTDTKALEACKPVTAAFETAADRHSLPGGVMCLAAFVRDGADKLDLRVFAPLENIPEDPATGSAAAALAAYHCQILDAPVHYAISQGVTMGRPSQIQVRAESPSPGASRVWVSGSAVSVMDGVLKL